MKMNDCLGFTKVLSMISVLAVLSSCGGGSGDSQVSQVSLPGPGFSLVPPVELQALGLPLKAAVIVSNEPGKRYLLTLDPQSGKFRGEIQVPIGTPFDIKVIFSVDDPATGAEVPVAHYIRRDLLVASETTQVTGEGDESKWTTHLDLSPGAPNELNSDGDAFSNYVEVGYRSDPNLATSIPAGATAVGERADPLDAGQLGPLPDIAVPPAEALHGEAKIAVKAQTPFGVSKIELISSDFGVEVLSPLEEVVRDRRLKLKIDTELLVVGPETRPLEVTVKITDRFGVTSTQTIRVPVFNAEDDRPPLRRQLGLAAGQVVTDQVSFPWEVRDPSGVAAADAAIKIRGFGGKVEKSIPVSDSDPAAWRLLADVTLDVRDLPDGTYTVIFSAVDSSERHNAMDEVVEIRVLNARPVAVCGDGAVEPGEECDDNNDIDTDSCTHACKNARCGDGIRGPNETCDDGNTDDTDGCLGTCVVSSCGDGHRQVVRGEECDDGNRTDTDDCTNACTKAKCGDRIVGPGEQCDDGRDGDNTNECTDMCLKAVCGDGFTQPTNTEECDDRNTDNEDGCINDCRAARCGDGYRRMDITASDAPGYEACDDGNAENSDACLNTCRPNECGDGFKGPGEECDDGNKVNTDACTDTCKNAVCGDGIPRTDITNTVAAGYEQCDDGDGNNKNDCTNACRIAFCGDGHTRDDIIESGDPRFEACDDGNTDNADDCSNVCRRIQCLDGIRQNSEPCDESTGQIACELCTRVPPVITIINPSEGETVRDRLAIDFNARSSWTVGLMKIDGPTGQISSGNINGSSGTLTPEWPTDSADREDQEVVLTFTARDIGDGAAVLYRERVVTRTVRIDNVPNITGFTGPGRINRGGTADLGWTVNTHTALEVTASVGVLPGSLTADATTVRVTPSETTTYTLTARRVSAALGRTFEKSATWQVMVNQPPQVSWLTPTALGTAPDGLVFSWQTTSPANDVSDCTGITRYVLEVRKGDGSLLFSRSDLTEASFAASELTGTERLEPRTDYSTTVTATDNCNLAGTPVPLSLTTSDTGLVGWWRMDEFVGVYTLDSSGHEHQGSLEPQAEPPVPGNDGDRTTLAFDGANDYIHIDDHADFYTPAGLTLEAWVKPDPNSDARPDLDQQKQRLVEGGGILRLNRDDVPGIVDFLVGTDGTNYMDVVSKEPVFEPGGRSARPWTHLVGVWDGGSDPLSLRLYVNGEPVAVDYVEVGDFTVLGDFAAPVRIGAGGGPNGVDYFYAGAMDEVAVYTRALTPLEIRQNCARVSSTVCDPLGPVPANPMKEGIFKPNADGTFPAVEWVTAADTTSSWQLWRLPTAAAARPERAADFTGTTGAEVSARLEPRQSYYIEVTATSAADASQSRTNSWRFATSDVGLVGWWRFDEGSGTTALDSSGNGNDGTLGTVNVLPVWSSGMNSGALTFDGDDYVTVSGDSTNTKLWFGTGDFTSEVWFRIPQGQLQDTCCSTLFRKGSGASGWSLEARGSDYTAAFVFVEDVDTDPANGNINVDRYLEMDQATDGQPIRLNDGQWHQLVGIRQGLEGKVYLDGSLIMRGFSNQPVDVEALYSNFILSIGFTVQGRAFRGDMDEAALYNRALSTEEVRNSCRRLDPDGSLCVADDLPDLWTPARRNDGQIILPPTRAFLSWQAGRTPAGKVFDHYQLCYATTGVDISGPNDCLNSTDRIVPYHVLDSLTANNTGYRWKVRTCYADGTCSAYSPVWSFSTDNSLLGWWKFDDHPFIDEGSSCDDRVWDYTNPADPLWRLLTEAAFTHPQSVGPACDSSGLNGVGFVTGYTSDVARQNARQAVGPRSSALVLDGIDDYVDLTPYVANLAFNSTADFTVEARFRPDGFPDSTATLFNLQGLTPPSGAPGVQLFVRSDLVPACELGDSSGSASVFAWDDPVTLGNFHHLAMAYDGSALSSKLSLVVNGSFGGSATGQISFNAGQFGLAAIGAITYWGPLFRPFQGLIDEIAIYNRALSLDVDRNNFCSIEALAGTDPLPEVCR